MVEKFLSKKTFLSFTLFLLESLSFAPAGLTRPAPAELPQDRKVARVGG